MKVTYHHLFIIVFASIICLLFPQNINAQLKHIGPSSSEKLAIQAGQQVLDSLCSGNTTYPYSQFDKQMKETLTEEQLAQVFTAIEQKCGKYQSAQNWQITKNGIYVIVTAQVNFELTSIQYLITFNIDDQIAGLYFKPLSDKK